MNARNDEDNTLLENIDTEFRAFIVRHRLHAQVADPAEQRVYYKGLTNGDSIDLACQLPAGFDEVLPWADGLARRVWVDTRRCAIITYCEHDVMVEIFAQPVPFTLALDRAADLYAAPVPS